MIKLDSKLSIAVLVASFIGSAVAQEDICSNFVESLRSCTPDNCKFPFHIIQGKTVWAYMEIKREDRGQMLCCFLCR